MPRKPKQHKVKVRYVIKGKWKERNRGFPSEQGAIRWARGEVSRRENYEVEIIGPRYAMFWRKAKDLNK